MNIVTPQDEEKRLGITYNKFILQLISIILCLMRRLAWKSSAVTGFTTTCIPHVLTYGNRSGYVSQP